jgi:hypothetical protein
LSSGAGETWTTKGEDQMVSIPEEIKELVFAQLQKPIFLVIGLAGAGTFTTGLLIGRWYGSAKIRCYNRRDDLRPAKPPFNLAKLKFWIKKNPIDEELPNRCFTPESVSKKESEGVL